MMKLIICRLVLLVVMITSCQSKTPGDKRIYCGYQLTKQEYESLRAKADLQKSAYDADTLGHIYDQLNDSIRAVMPDSVVFEVFLSLLNKDEVGIDIYVPGKKEFFEKIGCAIMNSNYKGKIPEQRYMCLYTYTNPDGSGAMPLEVAIKRME
jgi:hypothetical protein